jgi:hypothetical protein
MPRYLCKREGKELDNQLTINGVEIVRDLNRVWSNCIVYLSGKQARVHGVFNYKRTPVMTVVPTGSRDEYLVTFDHPKLRIDYPEVGYFNAGTSAIYLQRKVSRQWKQGLHSNTINLIVPFGREIANTAPVDRYGVVGLDYGHTLDFHTFLDTFNIFEPEYPTFRGALNTLLEARAMSVALSLSVVLVLHPANGEIHVMYHNDSVGAIDVDNNELLIRDEYFWLEDTLRGVITL